MTVQQDTMACEALSSTCAPVSPHLTLHLPHGLLIPLPTPQLHHLRQTLLHSLYFPFSHNARLIVNYPAQTLVPRNLNGSSVHTGGWM